MNRSELASYRRRLREMAGRVGGTVASLEESARNPGGGEASGGISNTPIHLGDLGTDAYMQELSATLLENENYIFDEVVAALKRLDDGTFGRCQECGEGVAAERLEALPYTPFCVRCSEALHAGVAVNMNAGRPQAMPASPSAPDPIRDPEKVGGSGLRESFQSDIEAEADSPGDRADAHAAGTAGGGTAVGGLAGTNIGDGDPGNADLERAAGSGEYDVEIEEDGSDATAYGGSGGGAVGGTPAGKRAAGGKKRGRGAEPRS